MESSDDSRERFRLLKEGLKRSGVRLTHQRMEVFLEVSRSTDHPDAERIYERVRERVPAISLDTVYRTLWLLLDLDLVSTLGLPRRTIRFDANVEPHHHFYCTRCGTIRDLHNEEWDRLELPEAASGLGSVTRLHVEARGLCARCQREPPGELGEARPSIQAPLPQRNQDREVSASPAKRLDEASRDEPSRKERV